MFKKLSLLKQLVLLLLVIVLVIFCFVSPLINQNLNRLVANQMYDIIDDSQSNYLNNFYNPNDTGDNKQVYHIYVEYTNQKINWKNVLPLNQSVAGALMNNIFYYDLMNQKDKEEYYTVGSGEQKIFYKISNIDGSIYLVSFIYGDYSTELIQSILTELVYVQYIVLFIVALVMVIWVWTLIKPLYQIENYINKIKKGEQGSLNIVRDDEIGQVSKALIEMKEELEQQAALKEEFMHNISHDLKTPIAVIKSYSESMKDDIYPYGTKESSIDVILENVSRLENKVRAFLYLNRLDFLKQESLQLEEVNMTQLITKIKSQLDIDNTLIVLDLGDEDVYFLGQEEHWRNVIENIVENAKRYCKSVIKISLRNQSLIIFNDGPKIDQKLVDSIFDPFTKGEKGNFGLGLSIVKKVTEMFGYYVQVCNVEAGVEFKIYK